MCDYRDYQIMCDYRDYQNAYYIYSENLDDAHFIGAANFLYNNHYNYFQESMDEWFFDYASGEHDLSFKHFTSRLMEIVV